MAKNWTWKILTGGKSSARLSDARPSRQRNRHGEIVRYHAPHPVAAPETRLQRKIKLALRPGEDSECWEWQGCATFRVSDDVVTTPARFAYEYTTGEQLRDGEALFQVCGGCNCIRPLHQAKAKTGSHGRSIEERRTNNANER